MSIPYYDNSLHPDAKCAGFIQVERVYCFNWHAFAETHWEELRQIYARLPGEVRFTDVPFWFGNNEELPPWLYASVEPSGLQVAGHLRESDWMAWDEQFRREAGNLPSFQVE